MAKRLTTIYIIILKINEKNNKYKSCPIQWGCDELIRLGNDHKLKLPLPFPSLSLSLHSSPYSSSITFLFNATSQTLNKPPNSFFQISLGKFISGTTPMAEQFSSSVEFGLNLSKRIHHVKESAPAPAPAMSRSPKLHLPSAPMCYAVIPDPQIVDNPDIRSYQPYVYGRCDPPALIPLQLHGIGMEVECCLDTAFVTVTGKWRVHCIMASSICDCQVAIPMGEQVNKYIFLFFNSFFIFSKSMSYTKRI